MSIASPVRSLFLHLVSKHAMEGTVVPGAMVDRLLRFGVSPLRTALGYEPQSRVTINDQDGITDSLKYIVNHRNFNHPGSLEHKLAKLLTKSF